MQYPGSQPPFEIENMAHFLLDDDKPIKNGETHKPPKNGGLVDFQGKTMVCKRYFLSKRLPI